MSQSPWFRSLFSEFLRGCPFPLLQSIGRSPLAEPGSLAGEAAVLHLKYCHLVMISESPVFYTIFFCSLSQVILPLGWHQLYPYRASHQSPLPNRSTSQKTTVNVHVSRISLVVRLRSRSLQTTTIIVLFGGNASARNPLTILGTISTSISAGIMVSSGLLAQLWLIKYCSLLFICTVFHFSPFSLAVNQPLFLMSNLLDPMTRRLVLYVHEKAAFSIG
ncbi:hypothetical protein EDB19DRAFT_1198886 [Suillus lakei]|nr:hypothetical protein EDB19DRAFT_1198886 [Suillus lakei]